jgi:hypothetical protein
VKPPARYRAYVPTSDLHIWLRTWDLDEDRPPKPGLTPICWRHAWQPLAWPVGWRVVRAGRVWQ